MTAGSPLTVYREPPHVDLWWFDLDAPRPKDAGEWLPNEDRERITRMSTEILRARTLATRVALRTTLAHYLNQPPGAIEIAIGEHGWPHWIPREGEEPLWFNLSHADGRMVMAVSRDQPVGVDLEWEDRRVAPRRISSLVCNEAECAWMEAQDWSVRPFLKLWTAKEAVLKLLRTGLQIPATKVRIDWDAMRGAIEPTAKRFAGAQVALRCIRDESPWVAHLATPSSEGSTAVVRPW